MTTVKPNLARLFSLLSEGNIDAAESFVEKERLTEVTRLRGAFEEADKELALMRSILAGALTYAAPLDDATQGVAPLDDARGAVLQAAADVARGNAGIATLDAVVKLVAERGISLNSAKPGTSIGNILTKATSLWERQGQGVYRLKM